MSEGMYIGGTNNRVAGRDYNENNHFGVANPCVVCETRFVAEERTICNHCTQQEQKRKRAKQERERIEQLKFYLVVILAVVLFAGFELHEFLVAHSLIQKGLGGLLSSMLLSATLLFFGYFAALWSWIYLKAWWRNKQQQGEA